MPKVRFTTALKRFFPNLAPETVPGHTVADVLAELDIRYPGLCDYLVDEQGSLRQHVNVYVGEQLVADRQHLSDALQDSDEVLIFQALSGG